MLKPLDIRKQEFARKFRGLDSDEVRVFLDLVADAFEEITEERAQLLSTVSTLEAQLEEYRGIEGSLRNALVLADRLANEAESRAKEHEQTLLKKAELRAESLVAEASRRKDELLFHVGEVRNQRAIFLARFRALLEGELRALTALETEFARERQGTEQV